jgi:hypothetical protein
MSKKKTKGKANTSYARQKLNEQQHKNDYIRRLRRVCDLIHPDLARMLVPIQMKTVYFIRGSSLRIVADGKMNREVLAFANEYARMTLRDEKIPLLKDGDAKISLGEYHNILFPLEWLIRPRAPQESDIRPNPEQFAGLPWYEAFFADLEREERYGAYHHAMFLIKVTISYFLSDHRYGLYYATYTNKSKASDHSLEMKMKEEIHIVPHRPERLKIKLPHGEPRQGIRCTLVFPPVDDENKKNENLAESKFLQLELPLTVFGVKGARGKKYLPVYVTEHAFTRLEERIGCGFQGQIQAEVFHALSMSFAPDYRPMWIGKDRLLMEYRLLGLKAGYLVVTIQNDAILVHTFLLITNHTTPEGTLLHQQLGLEKLDKQFLGIDRLDTFIHSDILQNEDICELFRHAGCASLIELCDKLKDNVLWKQDSEQIQLASRLREYLKKGEQEDWVQSDENEG